MSIQQRREVMYWFTLLVGMAILGMQLYQFFTGQLELTFKEGCVSAFAVVLMGNPNILSNGLKAFINSKTGKNEP